MTVRILQGDCRDVLKTLPSESVHSIVTDPPYHLTNNGGGNGKGVDNPYSRAKAGAKSTGFMGKVWDGGDVAFTVDTWAECLRVLKPGGHLLAFGGSRTYHRLVCAIEDAGFDIRDQIMWIYGSGFPKSKNLDGDWKGWGTALKPAHEPIVVARKPLLLGSVAANVEQYRCGALNIDGCRVGDSVETWPTSRAYSRREPGSEVKVEAQETGPAPAGRWPANVAHDGSDEVLDAFPDAPGQIADSSSSSRKTQNVYGAMKRGNGRDGEPSANSGDVGFKMRPGARRDDAGSAARFFYCAKASKADREAGCGEHAARTNHHPTVKPTELMRWLVRLVTPPGGTVLDPFLGSGSTARAADIEGFDCIGIELDPEYVAIATQRVSGDSPLFADVQAASRMISGSTTTGTSSSSESGSPAISSRSEP